MKPYRKILFFVALICLLYCVTFMQSTYAKYITKTGANATMSIARWKITINNEDILNSSSFENLITPIFEGNENIMGNIIAPTSEGYFDILINGTNTDVSYTYTINVDYAENNTVDDLVVSKYTVNNVNNEYNMGEDVTGDIVFDAANKVSDIRFYVEWNDDDETETMDNDSDTNSSIDGFGSYKVTINVVQKKNENS